MAGRSAKMLSEKRDDQAALASIMTAWNAVNTTCANPPPSTNYSCAPFAAGYPGFCGCTCSPITQTNPPSLPNVVAGPGTVASCPITIVSYEAP